MIDNKFKDAIKILHSILIKDKIKWAIIGSTNLMMQGMDVEPKDLDIVVRLKDLHKIPQLFSEYDPSPIKELKVEFGSPGFEVKFEMSGVNVQFLGEEDDGEYVSRLNNGKIIDVAIDNIKVPCLTLLAQREAYIEDHKIKKVKIIDEYLKYS